MNEHQRFDSREAHVWRRSRLIRPLAAAALLGSLAGCSQKTEQPTVDYGRNTPATARYSLDANPEYYADLRTLAASADPSLRSRIDRLEKQPVAGWLDADASIAATEIRTTLARTERDGTIPVFVSYAIPDRDLGGQSAGGLDAASYSDYVTTISRTIGDKPAIIVVEPDALAHLPDLDAAQRQERIRLLAHAVDAFHENPNLAVNIDAGNSDWRSPDEMAGYLKDVAAQSEFGIDGIALNVSNFRSDADTRAYSRAIEQAYGHPLYTLIDTSRNGNAAAMKSGDWCNPADQLLGQADDIYDARARVEEVYIKTPGESDGDCGVSTLPAGQFDDRLMTDQLSN